jgi:hypothetical protein
MEHASTRIFFKRGEGASFVGNLRSELRFQPMLDLTAGACRRLNSMAAKHDNPAKSKYIPAEPPSGITSKNS